MILIPVSIEKCVFSYRFGATALPSDLLHSHYKCNLYFDSSLKTVTRGPTLYKLLRIHNPNLITIFCPLGHLTKESIQVKGCIAFFVTN
jgi:hypothetical protein